MLKVIGGERGPILGTECGEGRPGSRIRRVSGRGEGILPEDAGQLEEAEECGV